MPVRESPMSSRSFLRAMLVGAALVAVVLLAILA
jgi:hypothetical protein